MPDAVLTKPRVRRNKVQDSMKYLYVYNIGCQMNAYDAEQFYRLLAPMGYAATDTPEAADLVIVNTCSIREKAEEKAFSFVGRMQAIKAERPSFKVGVGGCVAQQEGKRLLLRASYVDFVFGTHAICRLPEIVRSVEAGKTRVVDVEMSEEIVETDGLPVADDGGISSFVTIMRGCDNFCTYCVVPYVRGRENSRKPEAIVEEVRQRVAAGAREITLLGQNVNSYGKKEGLPSFPDLLRQVAAVEGVKRLRFATSHPKDLSDELIRAYGEIPNLCKHLHLPVQSGSNAVLKRMNRKYTRERYLERIARLREVCPEVTLQSDMIVGFPGETRGDFEETLSLVETLRYDGLFAFAYSDRPNAVAAGYGEKVPEAEKKARLQELLALQDRITREKNEACVETLVEVLVEGRSRQIEKGKLWDPAATDRFTGRTPGNRLVHFTAPAAAGDLTGALVTVRIERALGHSLWGSLS